MVRNIRFAIFVGSLVKRLIPLLILAAASALCAAPPNIVAIVTDDQSAWSLSCYGGKNLATPRLDRLAAEGARFTRAFVNSPVCSPSRFTYLTGRWPSESPIADWLTAGQASKFGLTRKFPTWPEILRENGYHTALVGKWHLGSRKEFQPSANGFDAFDGNLAGGWRPKNPTFVDEANTSREIEGDSVEIVTDLAIRNLAAAKEGPLALLVHYREPHAPYVPMPDEDMVATSDMDPAIPDYPKLPVAMTKRLTREYLTAVRALDRNIGRLLDAIEKQGIADNTIVIFTSDHGYNIGHHGLRFKGNGYWLAEGKKGCRPNMFDTSLKVPLIIRWPGVVVPGTVVDAPTANIDMLPSVLGMLDLAKPKKLIHHGLDFSPWLRGEMPTKWRDAIFGQYTMVNDAKHSMRSIRTDDWKLIVHYHARGSDELYDLKNDPGESTNLYADPAHAATREQLLHRLSVWMESIHDDPTEPPLQSGVRE